MSKATDPELSSAQPTSEPAEGGAAELVRRALAAARSRGFAGVDLSAPDFAFSATFGRRAPAAERVYPGAAEPVPEPTVVASPMVGYYARPTPPIAVGQAVGEGAVVAVLRVLGIDYDVPAGVGGVVEAILVEEGDPVEFGQPLVRLRAE